MPSGWQLVEPLRAKAGIDDDIVIWEWDVWRHKQIGPTPPRNPIRQGFRVLQLVSAIGFGVKVDQDAVILEQFDEIDFWRS